MFNRKFAPGTKTKTKMKVAPQSTHVWVATHMCARTYVGFGSWLPVPPDPTSLPSGVPLYVYFIAR